MERVGQMKLNKFILDQKDFIKTIKNNMDNKSYLNSIKKGLSL